MITEKKLSLSVFLASISILLFEMVHIRVFSYSLPPMLAYSGIGIAMTGFGAGAMLLSLKPSLGRKNICAFLSILLIFQSLSMMLSLAVFAARSWDIILGIDRRAFDLIAEILIPCALPYFFMGLFLALIFSIPKVAVGKLYATNLLGSGLGCVLIAILIRPVGAEKLLILSAILSTVAGVSLALPSSRKPAAIAFALLALQGGALAFAGRLYPFSPDPVDAVGYGLRLSKQAGLPEPRKEFSEWNIVGKVEVWNGRVERVRVPETLDLRILSVDSGATTQLIQDPGRRTWGKGIFEDTAYGIAYSARPGPRDVLVIGSGGGIDVHAALHWNAGHVTAVEINGSTIRAVDGPYAAFLKWPTLSDRVSIVHGDGRSFVKGAKERFDVIQMTGVDTMTVYATGAITMAEEYLYTVEAFEDYLSALHPRGVLTVLRYGTEYLRLTALATEALLRRGTADPGRNIVVFRQSFAAGIMVKPTPFTSRELDAIEAFTARKQRNEVWIPHFEKWNFHIDDPIEVLHLPGRRSTPIFQSYFKAASSDPGGLKARYPSFKVPTDDNPYYMLSLWMTAKAYWPFQKTFKILKTFWTAIILLAFVLILLPVAVARRRLGSLRPMLWVLPYFFLVGACFMLLEMELIHHFVIFVGSPGASMAAVLASMLVSCGIGSYTSELVAGKPLTKILTAACMLLAAALLLFFLSKPLFDVVWGWGWSQALRCIAAGLMIAPMGLAMGWFFPSGLKALAQYFPDSRFIPWAVSINGFASVVGSAAALPLSMLWGFNILFAAAGAGYLAATLLSFSFFLKK